jgi:beta-phosphoglucomutase-like phosphatase (HAD superfamily)
VLGKEIMGVYWSLDQRLTVNPQALIFDMDGVIVDSEALHESAKQQALCSAGIEVDQSVFAQYTGRTDRAMITDLAKVHGRSDDEVEAILLETQRLYTLGEPQLRPISGAIEFLSWAVSTTDWPLPRPRRRAIEHLHSQTYG